MPEAMYNVRAVKNVLRVAEARARFGEILDEAEQGTPVFIERRGVRFRVVAEPAHPSRAADPLFDYVDPAVLSGSWSWNPGRSGLRFAARRRR